MKRLLRALPAMMLAIVIAGSAGAQAVPDAVVNFGAPHPQPPGPASNAMVPDEVTINKGEIVLFVVNGAAHRVSIYPVSNHTTRADIEEDLCQGGAAVCNSAAGTANLQYLITDGKGDLIIDTQTNVQQPFISYQPGLLFSAGGPATLTSSPVPPAVAPPGHQVQVRFEKTGRYLVICSTRTHAVNDHMFGFVNVVGTNEP